MRKTCVYHVEGLLISTGKLARVIHVQRLAHVHMCTNRVFVRNLYHNHARTFAQLFSDYLRGGLVVIPVLHRTNNMHNKGNTL